MPLQALAGGPGRADSPAGTGPGVAERVGTPHHTHRHPTGERTAISLHRKGLIWTLDRAQSPELAPLARPHARHVHLCDSVS